MKKNIIKILTVLILSTSLVACNQIPTTNTSDELNNIYFLTDREYSYDEIIEWAIDNKNIKSSTLIAAIFTIECNKVRDYQTVVDFAYSKDIEFVNIYWDADAIEDTDSWSYSFSSDNVNKKGVIGHYNNYISREIPYEITFGFNPRYVLHDVKFEKGKHYVVFCGTIDNLLNIDSHKNENNIHNGQFNIN